MFNMLTEQELHKLMIAVSKVWSVDYHNNDTYRRFEKDFILREHDQESFKLLQLYGVMDERGVFDLSLQNSEDLLMRDLFTFIKTLYNFED